MMNLTILRNYAQKDPASLPNSILFSHSDSTLTVYDAYPKSIFHFLILPRIGPKCSAHNLDSLRTLLQGDKAFAREVITVLRDEASRLCQEIETEMIGRYGFKWDVWVGFHAVPSMRHLHLHVLSADLVSDKMKHKKHYNSFHPKLGFFLDIHQVLSWFDAEKSYFTFMTKLDPLSYEKILKDPLSCWHCGSEIKNMPTLKSHLQREWEGVEKKRTAGSEKKERESAIRISPVQLSTE